MIGKLKDFLRHAPTENGNPKFSEGGEYWHQDNSSYHRNRAEHYQIIATRALQRGNKEYSELNTKLCEGHRQLAEYHQKAATRRN